jgi:hypothetical protein
MATDVPVSAEGGAKAALSSVDPDLVRDAYYALRAECVRGLNNQRLPLRQHRRNAQRKRRQIFARTVYRWLQYWSNDRIREHLLTQARMIGIELRSGGLVSPYSPRQLAKASQKVMRESLDSCQDLDWLKRRLEAAQPIVLSDQEKARLEALYRMIMHPDVCVLYLDQPGNDDDDSVDQSLDEILGDEPDAH